MRHFFLLATVLTLSAHGQALRDINYRYLYNPSETFRFLLKPIKTTEGWTIFYQLQLRDTSAQVDEYEIEWERRSALSDKDGKLVRTDSITKHMFVQGQLRGDLRLEPFSGTQIIVARVINHNLKRLWFFYHILEASYPVDGYLVTDNTTIITPYVKTNTTYTVQGGDYPPVISYYSDEFPAAAPVFSEALGKVSKGMVVDSTMRIEAAEPIHLNMRGLYLIQRDTNDARGISVRAEDDYPKYSRLENLGNPLVYVCTKQEYERIKSAKGEKKAFDKVILSITGDAERAKAFMRSYFKRVELANTYFTSYKEGWKTDRGMIFIIFGLPDEIFRFSDREVWNYKSNYKLEFEFVKSSTVFDPDNFVLIRDKKYQQSWYEVIDLWRKARF